MYPSIVCNTMVITKKMNACTGLLSKSIKNPKAPPIIGPNVGKRFVIPTIIDTRAT